MTSVKLNDETNQTINRMKARYSLIQPDGSIRRRGEWCFSQEPNAVKAAERQPGVLVYDRETGNWLGEPAEESAIVEAVRDELIDRAIAQQASTDAPEAPAYIDPATGDDVQDPEPVEPVKMDLSELEAAIDTDALNPAGEPTPEVLPDTRLLDTMIDVLSDGGKAKKRKGRKDGKPKALSAKAEAQARAGIKVTDGEPMAKKAAKRRRDAASGGRGQ